MPERKVVDLKIEAVKDPHQQECSEQCCSRRARMVVNGFPLCEECMATKLGPVTIKLGTSRPIKDDGGRCS